MRLRRHYCARVLMLCRSRCVLVHPVPQVTHISDSASSGERSPRRHHGMAPDGATVKLVRRWQSRSHPQVACDRRAAHTACSCIASGRATANHTAATRIAASNATTVNAATLPLAWLGCSSGDQRTKHSLELLNLLTSRKPVKTPRAIRDPASRFRSALCVWALAPTVPAVCRRAPGSAGAQTLGRHSD